MGLVIFSAENQFGWFLLNFILYYVFMILAAVPHELGHAFMAKAVGFRAFLVTIGFGRTIYERPFCGFNFQVKSIPLGGFAFSTPKNTSWYRVKRCLVILAGPSANLLVVGLIFFLVPVEASDFDFFSGIRPASGFLIANLLCFAFNLWPRKIHTVYGEIPNDGLHLWRTLFLRREAIQAAPLYYYLYEGGEFWKGKQFQLAKEQFEQGLALYPEDLNLLNALGTAFLYQKQFPEARTVFLKLLDRPNLGMYYRSHFANNLAYTDVLIGGQELIEEADKYSKEAMENMPFVSYFKGTRGCVLVEFGKFDEGVVLLKEALDTGDNRHSKALNACYIALAEKKRGNMEESRKFADAARALDPDCMLLDRLV